MNAEKLICPARFLDLPKTVEMAVVLPDGGVPELYINSKFKEEKQAMSKERLKQIYAEEVSRLSCEPDRIAALAELVGMISGIVNKSGEISDKEKVQRIRFLLSNYITANDMPRDV